MDRVIIFGNSRFSEVAHLYLTSDSEYEIIGFTLDEAFIKEKTYKDLPVFPFATLEEYYPPDSCKLLIPIGYTQVNKLRKEKYLVAKSRKYNFISYVSSKAICQEVSIGENCFIFEENVIQPFTSIGDNCILASGNQIGHHSRIHNHCFFSSGSIVGGGTSIGECTFVGMNSTIRDDVTVGPENVIGAGSIILSNTEEKSVYSPGETRKLDVPSDLIRI